MAKIRVLLLDDHTMFREALGSLLNSEPDMELCLHAGTVSDAVVMTAAGRPDIVLLDLDLGTECGTAFLSQARENGFSGPVLVLASPTPHERAELLDKYRVSGFVGKDVPIDVLARSIREAVYGPAVSQSAAAFRVRPKQLTERETAVLLLVFQGLKNREIGVRLNCTEGAVKAVLHQVFRKTGMHNRVQLVGSGGDLLESLTALAGPPGLRA